MKKTEISRNNIVGTIVFAALSVVFLLLMASNQAFFDWTFARHQNPLSWYVRPIFLVPFCYYAFKRNPLGISMTVFLLLTSMFWFNEPTVINEKVREFLLMEKQYLTSDFTIIKFLVGLLVPASMTALAYAFWKRSLKAGLIIMVLIAVVKTLWSVVEGGTAGTAVIIPAMLGLVICIALVYYGFRRFNRSKSV